MIATDLPVLVVREGVSTLRSAMWPLARLIPLPEPGTALRPPVVMVHGYLGHAEMFRPLVRRLRKAGFPHTAAVGYPSTRVEPEDLVRHIARVVEPLARGGRVDLVGHSLGAVGCRAYLKLFGGDRYVRRFVSLGGPHAGTSMYRFTPPRLRPLLDPEGPWVRRLAEGDEPVPTVVIRSRYDHQVLPPRRAAISGAHEVLLSRIGHNGLLWSRRAHEAVVAALL
ncbi:MAG: triacylglycerol lipase [Myxococcota bacterium]